MISSALEAVSNFALFVIREAGYLGVFLLMVLQSVNIPIPSEITMTFSGALAEQGIFNFWFVAIVGALGSLTGSFLSYRLAALLIKNGWRERYKILRILISNRNLEAAEGWFHKYGTFSIFFGRLIPVVSTFISFPAGLAKMNIAKFSILTFAGAFVWSLFLAWLGFLFSANWQVLQVYFRRFDYLVLILLLAAIAGWLWHTFRNSNNHLLSDDQI